MTIEKWITAGATLLTALSAGGYVIERNAPADCSEPIKRWERQVDKCEARSVAQVMRDSDECNEAIERALSP